MDNQPDTQAIEVAEVAAWLQRQQLPILLDVRDTDEHAAGYLPGALLVPHARIRKRIAALVPDLEAPIVVYCATGGRSALAAQTLREMGYWNVCNMLGGFEGWRRAGLPWVAPGSDTLQNRLSGEQKLRYARHLRLPEIGQEGQRKLLDAKILCIGAGGLGSPASLYLAAAGVGRLGIIDDDVVEISNLQRQVLHTSAQLGMLKVDSAEQALCALNPDTSVTKISERLTRENALRILSEYDVILDGSDNFATRYLVNDAALRLAKPVVHAAIQRFEGQFTSFAATGAPCYRCLFPQPPPADAAPSCAEAGVLGVLPGVLGVLQATEAIKLILGIGEPLFGRLVVYDALGLRFRELRLQRDPDCPTCGVGVERSAIVLADYAAFCASAN